MPPSISRTGPHEALSRTETRLLYRLTRRYSMSVIWQLDADSLAVRDVWFGRTVIRSSYQLHYQQAQALLLGDGPVHVAELAPLEKEVQEAKLAELAQALEMLTRVARHLRAERDRGGALELEGVEVSVCVCACMWRWDRNGKFCLILIRLCECLGFSIKIKQLLITDFSLKKLFY